MDDAPITPVPTTRWDRFDFAFNCPPSVTKKVLKDGYQAAYAEVRSECEAMDLPVGFIIRASTMLDLFVKHQQTKGVTYGEDGGYANPSQEKDAINALQSIARDYDELLLRVKPKDQTMKGVPPELVKEALVAVLRKVKDPDVRQMLQMQFVGEFDKLGI